MSKRKCSLDDELKQESARKRYVNPNLNKHSLDSDEEDDQPEKEEVLNVDDIEGEEEGVSRQDDGQRMTAFNMKEEMEEGHFDKQGHFIWDNEKEIRDNWLDNIDWHKIKKDPNSQYKLDSEDVGLADESDSEPEENFNEIKHYEDMLVYMKPGETVNKSIYRLGGENRKLSSVERLKRKKAGTLPSSKEVIHLTELANNILTNTGNMDIYQETFEDINKKIEKSKKAITMDADLDMYADDFDVKEKEKITTSNTPEEEEKHKQPMWEFKWAQDAEEIQGPYTTLQMNKWVHEGYFKSGAWVRKHGEDANFYSSNRVDFELYL